MKKDRTNYERIGKQIQYLYMTAGVDGYSLGRHIWLSLVRGIFIGLGSVIGATVLAAIAVYFLQRFDWLPMIGDWFSSLGQTIEQ